MELTTAEGGLFTGYLTRFIDLAEDARTERLLGEMIQGIIGAERLCRLAAPARHQVRCVRMSGAGCATGAGPV